MRPDFKQPRHHAKNLAGSKIEVASSETDLSLTNFKNRAQITDCRNWATHVFLYFQASYSETNQAHSTHIHKNIVGWVHVLATNHKLLSQ